MIVCTILQYEAAVAFTAWGLRGSGNQLGGKIRGFDLSGKVTNNIPSSESSEYPRLTSLFGRVYLPEHQVKARQSKRYEFCCYQVSEPLPPAMCS